MNPPTPCPALNELPPPPRDKTGWPWTEATPPPAAAMPNGSPWPKISIVTPSYNQARFLEETIRSVLLQGYPNLEYVIIDDGSTDQSVAVIRKYEPWLAYWASQENRGQSHAINQGFARATGDILGWVNSDDFYMPGALADVAARISPGDGFIVGELDYVDARSRPFKRIKPSVERGAWYSCPVKKVGIKKFRLPYPAMFWTREVHRKAQPLAEDLHYMMDLDFILRAMATGVRPQVCESLWTGFRQHEDSKSLSRSPRFNLEAVRLYWRLAFQPGFRSLPCLREACRNIAYYCRKRMSLAMNQKGLLRATAWLAAAILAFPSWQTIRSNLGAFAHGIRATGKIPPEPSGSQPPRPS